MPEKNHCAYDDKSYARCDRPADGGCQKRKLLIKRCAGCYRSDGFDQAVKNS